MCKTIERKQTKVREGINPVGVIERQYDAAHLLFSVKNNSVLARFVVRVREMPKATTRIYQLNNIRINTGNYCYRRA